MICANCAAPVPDNAHFCPHCGYSLKNATPQLVIKPFFTPLHVFVSIIPIQIFFSIWGATIFGIVGFFIIEYFGLEINPWYVALITGILFLIFTPLVAAYIIFQRYSTTEYRFYHDHLDCQEGFWPLQHKTINLEHIIELHMIQRFWQRLFNLGTIVLSTAASDKFKQTFGGIKMVDIHKPQEVYWSIKRIIESAQSAKMRVT